MMGVAAVSRLLSKEYRDFDHYNLRDPVLELLYIICSTMTRQAVYRRVFRELRRRFPTRASLRGADILTLRSALSAGGMGDAKASHIRALLDSLEDQLGSLAMERWAVLDDQSLEERLMSLSGVGVKTARCVMLYSYNREVFPVDTHCWRLARRLGWIRPTGRDGAPTRRDYDRLQSRIPPVHRFSLHVNFVSHGMVVCKARTPVCGECCIRSRCRRIGLRD
jgi:endonuclease III